MFSVNSLLFLRVKITKPRQDTIKLAILWSYSDGVLNLGGSWPFMVTPIVIFIDYDQDSDRYNWSLSLTKDYRTMSHAMSHSHIHRLWPLQLVIFLDKGLGQCLNWHDMEVDTDMVINNWTLTFTWTLTWTLTWT